MNDVFEQLLTPLLMPIIQEIRKRIPREKPVIVHSGFCIIIFLILLSIPSAFWILKSFSSPLIHIILVFILSVTISMLIILILTAMFPEGL
jgi:hypothetical protein